MPELELALKQNAEALKTAEQLHLTAKAELKTAAPLIQKVRSIDQKLTDQKKAIENDAAACIKDAAKIEDDKKVKLEEQNNRDSASKELNIIEDYLGEHSRDKWLVSGLTGVEEQLGSLLERHNEILQKSDDEQEATAALGKTSEKLDHYREQSSIRKRELENAAKLFKKGKEALNSLLGDRLLREYRTEKETLLHDIAFLTKIAELEDHRAKLVDGKPCPLCGAEEHPYAEGNVPVLDKREKKFEELSELIKKAEEQESVIEKLEATAKEAEKKFSESEKIETAAASEKKAAEKSLINQTGDLKKLKSDYVKLIKAVLTKLQPLGISEIPESSVSFLLESLEERLRKWQSQTKKKVDIEKQISELDGELKRLSAVITTKSTALAEKQKALDSVKQEYADGRNNRHELYGDKTPNTEELRLNAAIDEAESAEKNLRALHDDAQQKLNSANTNIASLKERMEQRVSEMKKNEADFDVSLNSAGFTDEKQFLEARLTAEERDNLIIRAKDLDDRQFELKSKKKDRENRLATELAMNVTDKSLEELEPQFNELEECLKQLRDTIAELKHKLTANTVAKERVKEKESEIDARQGECARWDKLHGLIGSADGKKYRNFAQGLTFELMVSHANQQLEKMTDRYLLIRDEEQPLELNVVDNYQAGEIRSTKNLSGGESFIVSLTLALGLSNMASRKVRVDSLFLDEGFGTLDEDNLETALETLSSLHQEGKLIGIISHVPALKDRISTQISIDPISGGKSVITGPGCRRV